MWVKILSYLIEPLIRIGHLEIEFPRGEVRTFGQASDSKVKVTINDFKTLRNLVLNPDPALGEAYMDKSIVIEDDNLYGLLSLLAKNISNQPDSLMSKFLAFKSKLMFWFQQSNLPSRSKKNVEHHYDLSPELYKLFLDVDQQYSCAFFQKEDDSLEQAQINKKQHIAKKLLLKPGMTVLDIGCGWGGLSLSLAKHYDVNVLGITLSEEQKLIAEARAIREGLQDKVNFKILDYRTDCGTFDRIVSVGMFEHVGTRNYIEYFEAIRNKLKENGIALIHTIGRMCPPGNNSPWLEKYIFPGGYTPALSEMVASVEQNYLCITDIEVWRLHYAKTLRHWHSRFAENEEQIREIYDDRFCRMWRYYLTACEISFRHYQHVVFQVQITKEQEAVPLTRNYLYES